jgi:ABC-type phosphate transport system substrate-binding protein
MRAGRSVILAVVLLSFGVLAPHRALAVAASWPAGFSQTKTVTRVNLINGKNVLVDKRKVILSVNITQSLTDRQVVEVKWSGAHPTGGVDTNPNDAVDGQYQEYPMVILQCHGFAHDKAPLAEQITPETCFTSTPSERFYAASASAPFPPWRLDRYATAAGQRNATVNQPDPVPAECGLWPGPRFWLPYENAQRKVFPVGQGGCAGMPSEMSLTGGLGDRPANDTFAVTRPDGRGSAAFDIAAGPSYPDLGCSRTVPCALVAIPVMGISCDPAARKMPSDDRPTPAELPAAAAECVQAGFFKPGQLPPGGEPSPANQQELSVTGSLWWAASNWRNRFVVPLTFAPQPGACRAATLLQISGSELMDQAEPQWQPHFCRNRKLFALSYLPEGEPEAVEQLAQGTIESAFVSEQPQHGFRKPVVHAPVAATGFAVSFVIDGASGKPVTTLRLDPRLLAKLLTESYPGVPDVAEGDPELLHKCPGVPVVGSKLCTNPLTITRDPEFQALNPGLPADALSQISQATLMIPANASDEIWALTAYINASPAARAWLDGKPDPWGMAVNSAYQGMALPVSTWPLLSSYEPADWVNGQRGPQPCYEQDPVPVLPLIDTPVADLETSAEDVQFASSPSPLNCIGPMPDHLVALGPQPAGQRFLLGITSLADARRYGLGTASLLTYTKPGTPAKFTSPAGMTFTAPGNAALARAAGLLVPDARNHTWDLPYPLYAEDSKKAAGAYPGTMLVYADIPTKHLPAQDALDYARFLTFAVTTGQTQGGAAGDLPAGYLPLTPAGHLGAEAQYALASARAVAAQKGQIPPLP